MQGDAVHRRRHAEFAHAVMDVAAREVAGPHRAHALGDGEVGMRQIRRPADGGARRGVDDAERHLGRFARRDLGLFGGERRAEFGERAGDLLRDVVRQERLEGAALGRGGAALLPGFASVRAPAAGGAPRGEDRLRHFKGRMRPVERRAGGLDFGGAERRAMDRFLALLAGGAIADHGAAGDHGGARIGLGGLDRLGDGLLVMAVHTLRVPAGGLEAGALVRGSRKVGRPVN